MTRRACVLLIALAAAGADVSAQDDAGVIIALERAALERWGNGDPDGYLEIMEPDLTYFDPLQERRLDGREAMRTFVDPFRGKIKVDRFELIDPKVQPFDGGAILTFNLVSYVKQPDGLELAVARWNTTEVYRRTARGWRIVHSHFSYTKGTR